MAKTKDSIQIDGKIFKGEQALHLIDSAFILIIKNMTEIFDHFGLVQEGVDFINKSVSQMEIIFDSEQESQKFNDTANALNDLIAQLGPSMDVAQKICRAILYEFNSEKQQDNPEIQPETPTKTHTKRKKDPNPDLN